MYVIFGASGNVGRATVASLREAGHPVRAVVRTMAQRDAMAQVGCEVVFADLDDEASVRSALTGAHTAQILCPVAYQARDPATAMLRMIETAARALNAFPDLRVLALSDYGAELEVNTGMTALYRYLEVRFKEVAPRLTLLRSAEHMQNWGHMLPVALATGHLPTLHLPVDRAFPTVSASDVGAVAAQLLLEDRRGNGTRVVSVEGPLRYASSDVARILGEVCGHPIGVRALSRDEWSASLLRSGMNRKLVNLIIETCDTHNSGRIDAEAGTERRFGATEVRTILAALVSSKTGHVSKKNRRSPVCENAASNP